MFEGFAQPIGLLLFAAAVVESSAKVNHVFVDSFVKEGLLRLVQIHLFLPLQVSYNLFPRFES